MLSKTKLIIFFVILLVKCNIVFAYNERLEFLEDKQLKLIEVNSTAEKTIARGVKWILNQRNFDVGTLWVLNKLAQSMENKQLQELYTKELSLAKYKKSFKYYLKLFDSNLIIDKMPLNRAVTNMDLMVIADWLIAAVNYKDYKPSNEILLELFEDSYKGYYATHQLLAIMWLKEQGYPEQKSALKIKEIVEGIVGEQSKFNDLFVERIALVGYAGYSEKIKHEWIDDILSAQQAGGFWKPGMYDINVRISKLHTTILSVWSLIQYYKVPKRK